MRKAMRTVSVREARAHLSRLLREVEAGHVITITRAGRVVARLVPAEAAPRTWGGFEGRVRIDADAFDPLSDDEASGWDEGSLST